MISRAVQFGMVLCSRAVSMETESWEVLDVDDSDLSPFLRPCKRRHSPPSTSPPPPPPHSHSQTLTLTPGDSASQPTLIPGPAGAVQAAMMHRRARASDDPLPTQEFIRRVFRNGHESDLDFTTNPWLSALQFLRSHGMVDDADSVTSSTPLNSIDKNLNVARVPQVVAVVKSCTPNGFGDMMVTLKDPTGTIGASVHHKVFADGEFGKAITDGSVVVLQKVAVFSPTCSTCYLNITLRNIVKVFSKDCGPPSEQACPALSLSARHTTQDIARMLDNRFSLTQEKTQGIITSRRLDSRFFATERHEKSRMPGNPLSLPQERTEGIMTNLRLDSRLREVVDIDKQKGEKLAGTRYHSDNGNDRNQKTDLDRENLSLRQDSARPAEVSIGGALKIEMNDQPNPPKLGGGDNLACGGQGTSSSTKSVHISATAGHETEVKNHLQRQGEISNPISSIPRWTEEQLDELLAFDSE